MKVQILMYELYALIYWVSLIELLSFILAMVFFIKLEHMQSVFLFVPHAFRGICGIVINRKMPRSHHIIKDIDFTEIEDNEKSYLKFDVV